jgi:alpha-L-glutamate ligase-like protein
MLSILRGLKQRGVLAINRRNAEFTLKHNPRRLYPLVDDKVRTKKLALENGVPAPELYGVIEVEGQVKGARSILEKYDDFVIKPAHGRGGEGIMVIVSSPGGKYRRSDGLILDQEELNYHLYAVLSGLYSLGGQPDKAMIEYRVQFDPVFAQISYQGVPDIRIVVFLGVPVMTMVRLPTRMSQGKANLHQGAIGVGIDIGAGVTLQGVWKSQIIREHPDTGLSVEGVKIPHWDDLLHLASKCSSMTGLGYQGVDIVLDKDKGPMLLELNARPGLGIQIANADGLVNRLSLVEREHGNLKTDNERVAFAKEHFSVKPAPAPEVPANAPPAGPSADENGS